MKISKLEEGIIGMEVKTSGGSTQKNYTVTGKYVSGVARGLEAFSETMRQDNDDRDSFSPRENAASNFAYLAKQKGYAATYNRDERIEVRRIDGVH